MSKKVTNTEKNPNPEWLLGGNPNAIERQEAEGQNELVNSSQLPVSSNTIGVEAKEQYEKMGIKVIGISEGDEIFYDVILPTGWKKEATDHSMWNKLLDHKGRERAMFFYKAAFYDRSSHIDFKSRFNVVGYFEDMDSMSYRVLDADGEKVLFETVKAVRGDDLSSYYKRTDELRDKALKFLKEKYPNHEDINAYWD